MFFLPIRRRLFSVSPSWSRMRMMSDKIISSKIQSISSSSSSPWLMLPPKLNNDENRISYNFYSLSENRVVTRSHNMKLAAGGLGLTNPINHDLKLCGSSHGWLALLNPQSLELFLYDPISHRHIKLPPFHHQLPNFPREENHRTVTKLILSSSPDEEDCRALMIYNCHNTLAFCCPSSNDDGGEWTPIGKMPNTCYDDIAYSTRQNLFLAFNMREDDLETWDLTDPSSPRMLNTVNTKKPFRTWDNEDDDDSDYDELDESPKDSLPRQRQYLVAANENDHVLLLTRSVIDNVTPDGSYAETRHTCNDLYPHMTIDFDILVYDQQAKDVKPLVEARMRSLGDLALFVGYQSDSAALSATRFPELKPNSIYFTDPFFTRYDPNSHQSFGGHDIGIFDWENRTVSPCYYPCDVRSLKSVAPSPVWFFPRGGSIQDYYESNYDRYD